MKTPLVAVSLILTSQLCSSAASVFSDTFDYSGTPSTEPNLTTNQIARQAGGMTSSTYTKQNTAPAANGVGLNVSDTNNVLLFHTVNSAGASQSSVDLDTNFASALVGKKYTITLSNLSFERSATDITDLWFALSFGDSPTSITGPNSTSADAALLIRPKDAGSNI